MVTSNQPPRRLYIQERMDEQGLTVAKLAKLMGVARYTVYRWLDGSRDLNTEKIAKLARVLQCDRPEDLWHPPGYVSIVVKSETLREAVASKKTRK